MSSGVIVKHSQTNPPLAVLVALQFVNTTNSNIKVVQKKEQEGTELQIVPAGDTLKGDTTVLRYLARWAPNNTLYGADPFVGSTVDSWIDFGLVNLSKSDAPLEGPAATINTYLNMRTLLADYRVTIADIFVWSLLKSNSGWDKFTSANQKQLPNLYRWFNFLSQLPQFQAVATKKEEVKEKPKINMGATGNFDALDLPGAEEGKVVTRFPPEPSGFLHIGHAKAALLNNYYARRFKGKLIIRFDDTNPSKEKDEYVQAIIQDLKTLDIVGDKISYTSDFFDDLLKYAEQGIKAGKYYMDNTPMNEMRDQRKAGIASKFRDQSVEENLKWWNEMKEGTEEGQKYVLRAKIDPSAPNGALRDPTMYRCVDTPHHRTGTKYKCYPIYDFACPIVDSIEGVTHSLRSSEYHDRNPLYYWVVDSLGLRRPFIQDFARLNFAYILLSKRKLQYFVDNGIVSGWDDPRFPTIQGILRRGLTVEALREFVLSQGASKATNNMEMEKLWAVNKKFIDPIVPRYTAISKAVKCTFFLKDGPTEPVAKTVPRHKKNPSLGNKVISLFNKLYLEKEDATDMKEGEEVTLMDWGNAVVDKKTVQADGSIDLEGHLHLEGNFKTTEKKLTWVPAIDDLVPATLVEYDYLITKDKLDEFDDFAAVINPKTEYVTEAWGDANLRNLNKGDRIQLERRGYFMVDQPYLWAPKSIVLVKTPDGHSTHASSKIESKVPTHERKNDKKNAKQPAQPKKQ